MSKDVFAQYMKEHLLERKQSLAHINDPPKQPTTKNKIEALGSQRVEFENE
jgi:hypothetical protein